MLKIEKILSVIAPDSCIACDDENSLLCEACSESELIMPPPACYQCGAYSIYFTTCQKCRTNSPLSRVWIVTEYKGFAKQLVYELKFSSCRSAAKPIALMMSSLLPLEDIVVTHLPTSPRHRRSRGFDQTALIAKQLATRKKLPYLPLLSRVRNVQQRGASKSVRKDQIAGAFRASKPYVVKNAKILLVDDVMTTGASVEEAARTLKKAGAKEVSAIVFAR